MFWTYNNTDVMRPKSLGTSIMVSAFMCSCHGIMKMNDLKSYRTFEAGSNREGWFCNDNLIKQLREILYVIEALHENCDLLFAFDNSMSHHKAPPDGLDAKSLTLNDNGKNIPDNMRDGTYINEHNEEIRQPMRYTDPVTGLIIKKGIRTLLMERKKWRSGMLLICGSCRINQPKEARTEFEPNLNYPCCATYVLSNEPDFASQREWLREVIEEAGHKIIFYPKYHPELNYIEMVWCKAKAFLRRKCSNNYNHLKRLLPQVLEEEISVPFVRRIERHCLRIMSAYCIGLEGPILDYATKEYRSHRRLSLNQMSDIQREFCERTGKEINESSVGAQNIFEFDSDDE